MIKKITLAMIFFFLVISCGKKGDPVYKQSKTKTKIQNVLIYKA